MRWEPPKPRIPPFPPKMALYVAHDGKLWTHCWYHPLDAAAEAERLQRLGYAMWVFEAVEVRPVAGRMAFELYLQGKVGHPAGSVRDALSNCSRAFPAMSLTLVEK